MKKIAFIFPGQGSQYCGMGRDFACQFPQARHTFEEGDDLLERKISKIAFEGPSESLKRTENSQLAIFMTSVAILRTLHSLFPSLSPSICSGLSLGECSALHAAGYIDFSSALTLVQKRGQYMSEACKKGEGGMLAIIGLSSKEVEDLVDRANLPHDLWVAIFNCPGQTVVCGTKKGIGFAEPFFKEHGARRVVPLDVQGPFHSALMQSAADQLRDALELVSIGEGAVDIVMNASGSPVKGAEQIKRSILKQMTHPVLWEQSIRCIEQKGVDLFLEVGCGKVLAGLNKRIGVTAPTVSIDKVEDLQLFEKRLALELTSEERWSSY